MPRFHPKSPLPTSAAIERVKSGTSNFAGHDAARSEGTSESRHQSRYSLRRANIFAQGVLLVLKLTEPRLHHVADRNDADEPSVFDHRNVPEPAAGDALHDFGDRFIAIAGDHLAGHHLCHGGAERCRTFLVEQPYDIALRDDPDDAV